jgi:hypothetical protein
MYYIRLDVHKRTISYCVKDAAGCVHSEGKIGTTRRELDAWVRTLPQPRMMFSLPRLMVESSRVNNLCFTTSRLRNASTPFSSKPTRVAKNDLAQIRQIFLRNGIEHSLDDWHYIKR